MATIKAENLNLLIATPQTFFTSDTASGVTAIPVKNTTGFTTNQVLILGNLGNEGSEIVKTHASTPPTTSSITLTAATVYPHSASTNVQLIQYDQVEFSTATTVDGMKSVLATIPLWADNNSTNYIDNAGSVGYYFTRFKNTINSTFSAYSAPIPVTGFGLLSARRIIDSALGEINKQTSGVLSDSFAFQQIDNCQTEVIRELKRWSWMQKFDAVIGQVTTGSWRVAVPVDMDDQNTNKSVFQLRIGTQQRLVWVDKEKFDEFFVGVAYNTLAQPLINGDTEMVLNQSGDFTNNDATPGNSSGTVTIGANTYQYSDNDVSTGTLTLTEAVTTDNTAAVGDYVFQGATQGLPNYWTTYGGYIYYNPNTSQAYNNMNLFMDYYIKQIQTTTDDQEILFPDVTVAVYYLCWKFLKKLNNGQETPESQAYQGLYLQRREKMKQKEVNNTTFKLRPRYQNFAVQTQFSEDTPRWIRDANFPNTGF